MSTANMSSGFQNFVPYNPSVEVKKPTEERVFAELAAAMRGMSATFNDRSRQAHHPMHAGSHGLLKGMLHVYPDLPSPYAQGLFRAPADYGVAMRFSTDPGDVLPDSSSTPRGLAVKVIGVQDAEMVAEHTGQNTQDFVLVNVPVVGIPDAEGFLRPDRSLATHAADSQSLKQLVSTSARAAEYAVRILGGQSALLKHAGHPETNLLGETYYSQVPLRYGNCIAKISVEPFSESLKELTGQDLDVRSNHAAPRDAVVGFFRQQGAEWEMRVQLCTDLSRMPVEDASVEWPEEESPYVPVARIVIPAQDAYSPGRRVFFDELLSFNPWHSMKAHQPLGNVMRVRRQAYVAASQYRHAMNGREMFEPHSFDEIPD